jgi:1,4-alpha-glucan branching enzyme
MAAGNGKRRVIFTLEAPEAQEVYLCGTFNDWDPTRNPMKPDGKGGWRAQLLLPPGTYEYRVRIDGEWRDDPQAEAQVPNSFGSLNSVREVQAAA